VEVAAHIEESPPQSKSSAWTSKWLMTRVVLPVPVSPKIAMFLAASRRLRDVRVALQTGGISKRRERSGCLTYPEAEVARLAEVRADGRTRRSAASAATT